MQSIHSTSTKNNKTSNQKQFTNGKNNFGTEHKRIHEKLKQTKKQKKTKTKQKNNKNTKTQKKQKNTKTDKKHTQTKEQKQKQFLRTNKSSC